MKAYSRLADLDLQRIEKICRRTDDILWDSYNRPTDGPSPESQIVFPYSDAIDKDEADFARLKSYVRAMPPAQTSFTVCTPSPGTDDYATMEDRIWVDNPHDLHDCMHPLTPTKLPLKKFFRKYAEQIRDAGARHPLRVQRRPVRIPEIPRLAWAGVTYGRAFESAYRDFPREMWG